MVQSIANSIQHPEYLLEHPAEFARELLMAYISQNSLTAILFSGSQANHFADSIERSIKQMIFEKYPEFEEVYDNADAYPQKLLVALCNNPEMIDFVKGYPDADGSGEGWLTKNELSGSTFPSSPDI